MDFTSTIRLADLNDYIAPSQDCVVALNGKLRSSEVGPVLLTGFQPPERWTVIGVPTIKSFNTFPFSKGLRALRVRWRACLAVQRPCFPFSFLTAAV